MQQPPYNNQQHYGGQPPYAPPLQPGYVQPAQQTPMPQFTPPQKKPKPTICAMR